MPTFNPTDILLAHDRWATSQLIRACEPLTREEFHAEFDMGLGSLHDTLRHMLGAMRGWTDMLKGEYRPGGNPRPRIETEGEFTPSALLDAHTSIYDEFESQVRAGSLDDAIEGTRNGKDYAFARGAILTHVTTHGMHHRAQSLNMLRRLGKDGALPVSVVEWTLTTAT